MSFFAGRKRYGYDQLIGRSADRNRGWGRQAIRDTFSCMTVQLHPEAAKRFDELGKQLLIKITPEPRFSKLQEAFRPGYPSCLIHMPNKIIIGDIGVRQSIIDGTGEEVGRFFGRHYPKDRLDRRWIQEL